MGSNGLHIGSGAGWRYVGADDSGFDSACGSCRRHREPAGFAASSHGSGDQVARPMERRQKVNCIPPRDASEQGKIRARVVLKFFARLYAIHICWHPYRVRPDFFGGVTGRLRCATTARLLAVNPSGSRRTALKYCPANPGAIEHGGRMRNPDPNRARYATI